MVLDQVALLESRRRSIVRRMELIRAGKWWHVGTAKDAQMRLLAELNEVDYELLCIQAGMKPREDLR